MVTGESDFNFAIPELPYISGRECAGEVVQTAGKESRFKKGDRVCRFSSYAVFILR